MSKRSMLCRLTAAVTATACAAAVGPALAGNGDDQFNLIAETVAEPVDGDLVSISSATLNQNDQILVDARLHDDETGGTQSAILLYEPDGNGGWDVTVIAQQGEAFDDVAGAVLNNSGDVAFVGLAGGERGIYLAESGSAPVPIYTPDADEQVLAIGELAINDAGRLVFWQVSCADEMCLFLLQCVLEVDINNPGADPNTVVCSDESDLCGGPDATAAIGGITLNNNDTLLFRLVCEDTTQSLWRKSEDTPVIGPVEGQISSAALNDNDLAALFIFDAGQGLDAGIYTIEPGGSPQLFADLTGDLTPGLFSMPVINNDGAIAFGALRKVEGNRSMTTVEGLFRGPDAEDDRILSAGDDLFGSSVAGSIQAYGMNPEARVLFRATLDDGRVALGLSPTDSEAGMCTADLNGDGAVGVSDLLILIGSWGACADPGDCSADLNDDGSVGIGDLMILIGAWGDC